MRLRFFALTIEANGNTWSYVLSEAHAVEADRDWRARGAKVTSTPALPARQTNAPAPGVGSRGARTGDRLNCQGETATAPRSKHAKRSASTRSKV
jgi:hypothetical protein